MYLIDQNMTMYICHGQVLEQWSQICYYCDIYVLLKLSSCMYVCVYVCSQNTAKTVRDSAKILGPPYSPFSCGVQYQVLFKSGNEKKYLKIKKLFKKSIPDSVKYSSGEFDQCKQPQWYSLLELSCCFFWKWFFLSTAVTTGTKRVHGSSSST